MFQIFPHLDFQPSCPLCHTFTEFKGVVIPGMRPLVDVTCPACHRSFYQDLPVSHALLYPTAIDQTSGEVFYQGLDWYPLLLKKMLASRAEQSSTPSLNLRRQTNKNKPFLLILDCLDTYYGHSLLKLLNAEHHLQKDTDHNLLVIVPAFLAWMVPKHVDLVLEVDLPLRHGYLWLDPVDTTLQKLFSEYERVDISPAYSHPHPSQVTIGTFIPDIPRFSMASVGEKKTDSYITFISREDRLWISSECISKLLQKFSHYFFVRWLKIVLILYQNKKIIRLLRAIRQQNQDIRLQVIGLGKTGHFPSDILDLREMNLSSADMERAWCAHYAKSIIAIGVHGSNMLLPSAFAGMVINILPTFKFGNFLQDLLVQESDPRLALFRYRILPITTNITTVTRVARSMLYGFQKFYTNNILHTYHEER